MKDWEIVFDGKSPIPMDLSLMTTAPTAYYETVSIYIYGTGFN
jgi:hypothetical protein